MKPRLFIGSSVEGLPVANAVQENLERDVEATIWNQGVFTPSAYPIEGILQELSRSDFGLFVFSPDDELMIRGQEKKAVRDNVIFELGLFICKLDRKRNFILMPRGVEDVRWPTDLAGLSPLTYDPHRQDGNLMAALGPACNQVRLGVKRLGPVSQTVSSGAQKVVPADSVTLSDEAKQLLIEAAADPHGYIVTSRTMGGLTIQTNRKPFGVKTDPRSRAIWKAAIEELLGQGLVESRGGKGESFGVTATGYKVSDAIKPAGAVPPSGE